MRYDNKDDGITVAPNAPAYDVGVSEKGVLEVPQENELHRALKARHITMIGELLFLPHPRTSRIKQLTSQQPSVVRSVLV
jgi:hypothetical protein